MDFWVFLLIFLPLFIIGLVLRILTNNRRKIVSIVKTQPAHVTTTANVIYTIPTNDSSRFATANVSASASVHHHYDQPPSYDQVVHTPTQTPTIPTIATATASVSRPPSFSQTQAVPQPL